MTIEQIGKRAFGSDGLERIREELIGCMRCGFCLSVCPIYSETGTETNSPRGWLALTKAVVEERHPATRNFAHLVTNCLSCKACTSVCPPGVPIDDLILAARALTAQSRRGLAVKAALLRLAMGHPARMDRALMPVRLLYQRSGLQSLFRRWGLGKVLPFGAGRLDQFIPAFARRSGRKGIPYLTPAQGERKHRVGYFQSCMDAAVFPESARATVAVLAANGCEVVTPPATACCGMPSRALGDLRTVRECASWNAALFEKAVVDAVIVDCATCGSMLREYPGVMGTEPSQAQIEAFSRRVVDVSAFLSQIGCREPERPKDGIRVTYHDPCHLGRGQGVTEEPRRMLELVGAELVEMAESDLCCGGAGSYNVTHPELSLAVLERKMANIKSTGASVVATGCPACQIQLQAGVKRHGLSVGVVHPVVLLAQAYALERQRS